MASQRVFFNAVIGGLIAGLPLAADAQTREFVADELIYDSRAEIVELLGSVELKTDEGYFYVDYLEFDINTERFVVEGNLNAITADGTLVIAEFGTLDQPTQQLVLREAKALLTSRIQLASSLYVRTDTFDYGEGVIVSSCSVCRVRPIPLWALRADQIYLDNDVDKIYVRNGTFEVLGVPVAYAPKMRFPGPDATRLEGFLSPTLVFSDRFLSGIEIPYYWVIGDYADLKLNTRLTIDPIVVSDFRYRQNFANGSLTLDGGYLFVDGDDEIGRYFTEATLKYDLPYGFDLVGRYTVASDYDFQPDFNFGDYSRDDITITRFTNDSQTNFEIAQYRPSSEAAKDGNLLTLLPYATYERRFNLDSDWNLDLRASALVLNQTDEDNYRQALANAEITRTDIFGNGIIGELELGADLRWATSISKDDSIDDKTIAEIRPYLSYDLAWPLTRVGDWGRHSLTPRLGFITSQSIGVNEFDETTIKFAGADDYIGLFSNDQPDYGQPFENTTELRVGVDYALERNNGDVFELALGRSVAFDNDNGDSDNIYSELVGYANYYSSDWSISNRFGLDDDLSLTRFETGFDYSVDRYGISVDWIRLIEAPAIGVTSPVSELELDGRLRIGENWQVDYGYDYDLENSEPYTANLGVIYGTECIEVTVGAEWDFDKGEGIEAERSLSFNIEFLGLTAPTNNKWGRQQCS